MNEPQIRRFDEPFKPVNGVPDDGVIPPNGDGILVPNRTVIKTRRDAPHLVVCIPVGGRDELIVSQCEHCGKATRAHGGNSYRAPGVVPAELLANFVNMMSPLGCTVSFMYLKNNLSAVLREKMAQVALERGANFLFFWDDDVVIPGDTWYKMLVKMNKYPDIGAITGVYFTKMRPTEPVLYKDAGVGAYWGFNLDPNAEPEDIHAAGAGCLMVRAAALRKMEPPWWADERHTSDDDATISVTGHDFRFLMKMRAESGYRTTVDGSIQCVHIDTNSQTAFRIPTDRPPMEVARKMQDEYSLVGEPETKMPELRFSVAQIDELLEKESAQG